MEGKPWRKLKYVRDAERFFIPQDPGKNTVLPPVETSLTRTKAITEKQVKRPEVPTVPTVVSCFINPAPTKNIAAKPVKTEPNNTLRESVLPGFAPFVAVLLLLPAMRSTVAATAGKKHMKVMNTKKHVLSAAETLKPIGEKHKLVLLNVRTVY